MALPHSSWLLISRKLVKKIKYKNNTWPFLVAVIIIAFVIFLHAIFFIYQPATFALPLSSFRWHHLIQRETIQFYLGTDNDAWD